MQPGSPNIDGPEQSGSQLAARPRLVGLLFFYTVLRIALIVVLAALLSLVMIPLVALVFAVVLQLPLAWLLFARLRRRVNEAVSARQGTRRVERDRLRAALRGEGEDAWDEAPGPLPGSTVLPAPEQLPPTGENGEAVVDPADPRVDRAERS